MSPEPQDNRDQKQKVPTVLENDAEVDDVELKELGYAPELKRIRGFAHIFNMTLTIFAIPFGFSTSFYTALIGGGPATFFWGPLFVALCTLSVAFSVGEIASRFPTSAGPYYWTFQLAPRSVRTPLSYVTGWLFVTGALLSAVSVAFGNATLVVGCINIYNPDYVPPAWLYVVIAYGFELLSAVPIVFAPRILPLIDYLATFVIWIVETSMVIALAVRAKAGRHSAAYAFGHYDSSFSGWGAGWTFFIGCLPAAYTNCAVGLISSMSEEVHRPERTIPRAMVLSVPFSLVLAWCFALTLNFTMADIATLIAAPGGTSIATAFQLILGSNIGAVVLLVGVIIIGFNCLIASNTAASRLVWSFSRDHALPASRLWAQVTPSGNIPAAIALCITAQMLLILIRLGNATTFNAFAGVAVIAFAIAYSIPVLCSMFDRRRKIAGAPFSSRFWGPIANWVMVFWTALACVLFSMPISLPVTADSMNYASVVLAFFAVFSAVWYYVYAHKVYAGPPDALIRST